MNKLLVTWVMLLSISCAFASSNKTRWLDIDANIRKREIVRIDTQSVFKIGMYREVWIQHMKVNDSNSNSRMVYEVYDIFVRLDCNNRRLAIGKAVLRYVNLDENSVEYVGTSDGSYKFSPVIPDTYEESIWKSGCTLPLKN